MNGVAAKAASRAASRSGVPPRGEAGQAQRRDGGAGVEGRHAAGAQGEGGRARRQARPLPVRSERALAVGDGQLPVTGVGGAGLVVNFERHAGGDARREAPGGDRRRGVDHAEHPHRAAGDRGVAFPGEPPERVVRARSQPLTLSVVELCEAMTDQRARSVSGDLACTRSTHRSSPRRPSGRRRSRRLRPGRSTGPCGRATARRALVPGQRAASRAARWLSPMTPMTVGGVGGRGPADGGRPGGPPRRRDAAASGATQAAQRAGRDRRTGTCRPPAPSRATGRSASWPGTAPTAGSRARRSRSSSSVMSVRPMPRPRCSGATLTLATPAHRDRPAEPVLPHVVAASAAPAGPRRRTRRGTAPGRPEPGDVQPAGRLLRRVDAERPLAQVQLGVEVVVEAWAGSPRQSRRPPYGQSPDVRPGPRPASASSARQPSFSMMSSVTL